MRPRGRRVVPRRGSGRAAWPGSLGLADARMHDRDGARQRLDAADRRLEVGARPTSWTSATGRSPSSTRASFTIRSGASSAPPGARRPLARSSARPGRAGRGAPSAAPDARRADRAATAPPRGPRRAAGDEVRAEPGGQPDRRRAPQRRRRGQPARLVAGREDGPTAEEADAGHDLGGDPGRVGTRAADDLGPDVGERRRRGADDDVGPQPRRLAAQLAVEPDHGREARRRRAAARGCPPRPPAPLPADASARRRAATVRRSAGWHLGRPATSGHLTATDRTDPRRPPGASRDRGGGRSAGGARGRPARSAYDGSR
jgi:hypothetical protein